MVDDFPHSTSTASWKMKAVVIKILWEKHILNMAPREQAAFNEGKKRGVLRIIGIRKYDVGQGTRAPVPFNRV